MRRNSIFILILVAVLFMGGLYYFIKVDNKTKAEVEPPKEDVIVEAIEPEPEEETEPAGETEENVVVNPGDIAIGALSPDFKLKNLNGEDVSLSDYKGKIVLINFWATWCTWCDKEMPDLNKLDKENDDLVVLAVNSMEDKPTVEKYINKGGYEFDVVLDEDGEITRQYLVSAFPTSYFVDKEGILLGGIPGMLEYDQMVEIIESIREER